MPSASPSTGWTGWLRRSGRSPWQAVCTADDIGSCHRQLLRLAEQCSVKCVHTFLTGPGRRPPDTREGEPQ